MGVHSNQMKFGRATGHNAFAMWSNNANIRALRRCFYGRRILRECEATRSDLRMRIANKRMRADDLFNAIVKDATTSFASTACLCVRMTDETSRAFYNLIGDKFALFPMRLIDSTVDYDTWSLVAGNTTRTDCDGRVLTADKMREKLNQVKVQRSATSNVIDEDDDDDDDDDNNDNNVVTTTMSTETPDARGRAVVEQRLSPPTEDINMTIYPRVFVPRSAKRKRGRPIKRRRKAAGSNMK